MLKMSFFLKGLCLVSVISTAFSTVSQEYSDNVTILSHLRDLRRSGSTSTSRSSGSSRSSFSTTSRTSYSSHRSSCYITSCLACLNSFTCSVCKTGYLLSALQDRCTPLYCSDPQCDTCPVYIDKCTVCKSRNWAVNNGVCVQKCAPKTCQTCKTVDGFESCSVCQKDYQLDPAGFCYIPFPLLAVILGIIGGIVFVTALVVIICCCCKRKYTILTDNQSYNESPQVVLNNTPNANFTKGGNLDVTVSPYNDTNVSFSGGYGNYVSPQNISQYGFSGGMNTTEKTLDATVSHEPNITYNQGYGYETPVGVNIPVELNVSYGASTDFGIRNVNSAIIDVGANYGVSANVNTGYGVSANVNTGYGESVDVNVGANYGVPTNVATGASYGVSADVNVGANYGVSANVGTNYGVSTNVGVGASYGVDIGK